MPSIENKRILPYNIATLYKVITNGEDYSDFIPWCKEVKVISEGSSILVSDVKVEFLFIKEKYRSMAKFKPPADNDGITNASTEITMIDGPFSHFVTKWSLKKLEANKTFVDFKCDFAFKNRFYDGIANLVLTSANDKIIDAFIARAESVEVCGEFVL